MILIKRSIFVIFCISCYSVSAQDQNLITGNFAGYNFPRFVREIEAQTPYHIYYDSTETDSLEINLNADRQSLQQAFDIIFKNTNIHYALGTGNNVFVSKRYSIQTSLPRNFFDPGKSGVDNSQPAFYTEEALAPKTNLKILPENKL